MAYFTLASDGSDQARLLSQTGYKNSNFASTQFMVVPLY